MTDIEKIMAELRKDKEFADCTEDELREIAQMEVGTKESARLIATGDKRDRKPRTPKEDEEKLSLAETIKTAVIEKYPDTAIVKQGEIQLNKELTIKIIRHRKK